MLAIASHKVPGQSGLPSTSIGFSLCGWQVYNARKRSDDNASMYFQRTEDIAGVKDMRFQALMPDVLHWLGVKKIDHMISMRYVSLLFSAVINSSSCLAVI